MNPSMSKQLDILVIDDEPDLNQIVCEIFSDRGYIARGVTDPFEGLEIVRNTPVSLVVMDFAMPGMTGIEAIERMREESIPVSIVLLTAYASHEKLTKAMQLGALDYIQKPFQVDELAERIETLVEIGRRVALLRLESPGTARSEKAMRLIELFKVKLAKKTVA